MTPDGEGTKVVVGGYVRLTSEERGSDGLGSWAFFFFYWSSLKRVMQTIRHRSDRSLPVGTT